MYEGLYAMRYLLDTHTLIWYMNDKTKLPKQIERIIDNPNITICISIVSIWEIVIKLCVKRLFIGFHINDIFDAIKCRNFVLLPVKKKHLNENLNLPLIHGDPFDRLLIATAISENMKFITSDKENQLYDVEWMWEK